MLLTCLPLIAALVVPALAIGKVTRGGRYLYNDDGSRFYIKGIILHFASRAFD